MIALVDDEPRVRQSVSMMLRAAGFTVTSFESVDDFLRAEVTPDLLLIDHAMPNTTGLEFLQRYPNVVQRQPVIMMTAYSTDVRQAALVAGAAQVIEKPFPPSTLFDAIARLLPAGPRE